MSDQDRADQIRDRLAAATPGPWVLGAYVEGHEQVAWTDALAAEEGIAQFTVSAPDPWPRQESANAVLIAEMPSDLAWLLDQRRDLLARVEAAERAGAVKVQLVSAWAEGYHAAEDGKQMNNPYVHANSGAPTEITDRRKLVGRRARGVRG